MGKTGAMTANNPARDARDLTIASDRIKGATYQQIAERHGITKSRVGQILTDDEIRDVVETGQRQMISLVPKAVDNYQLLLDDPDSKIRLAASKDVSQAAGILPTHMQSLVINQIYNDNRQQVYAPEVLSLLRGALQVECDPAVDADIVVDEGKEDVS